MNDRNVRERLIKSAVRLFADKGFAGTATRDIARLAEVNETSLFRVFGTKEELFWAALKSCMAGLRMRRELQQGLAEDAIPQIVLPLLVEFSVHVANSEPDLVRLLAVGFTELRPQTEIIAREAFTLAFRQVRDYFSRCIERGAMRRVDPAITAIALITTAMSHFSLSFVVTGVSQPYANPDEAILAHGNYWLGVLLPASAASTTRSAYSISTSAGAD